MIFCNQSYSDFVCWTLRGIHIEYNIIMRRDENEPQTRQFLLIIIILFRILSGQMDQENEPTT